jgi:hypothetical protein
MHSTREFCNQCSEPRKLVDKANPQMQGGAIRPGDWLCSLCENRNFGSRSTCKKCQADKNGSDLKMKAPPAKFQGGQGGLSRGPATGPPQGPPQGPVDPAAMSANSMFAAMGGYPAQNQMNSLAFQYQQQQLAGMCVMYVWIYGCMDVGLCLCHNWNPTRMCSFQL